MKILMLNPPFLEKFSRSSRSPAKAKGGTIYYPLWLAYATGLLEKQGHEVKLIDAPAKKLSFEQVQKIAEEFQPKIIVSDTSTASIYNDAKVLADLKKHTHSFTVLVGTHVSALPEWTLETFPLIDAVAVHEYDYILRDLAKEFENSIPNLENIKGLVYRTQGQIRRNPDMPLIQNLDEIPFVSEVYKKHLNIKDYFYSANLYPEITIVSSRGCPYQCKFCVWPQTLMGHEFRTRSLHNLIAEIKYIEKEFPNAKEIMFEDDTFTANKQRILEFSKLYKENNLKITWSANARADLDYETLQAMKECNCRLLCVGIESAEQEILNNIKKGTKVEGIRKFMKDSKKAGILIHGCFMMGNQGETKESIRKTIDFAKELNPDTAQFFPIMVYPGTETFNEFKEAGYLTTTNYKEWLNNDGQHQTIVSRPNLSNKELVQYCDLARKEFYMRPSYIFKKVIQAITQPREAIRILKSSRTFFRYLFFGSGFESSHTEISCSENFPSEEKSHSEESFLQEKQTEEVFFPRHSCSGCPLANQCQIKENPKKEIKESEDNEKT